MTKRFIAGGTSGEFLTSGEFAVAKGRQVETHTGIVTVPGSETGILYPRITNVGGFKFAGQGHSDALRQTYVWSREAGWETLGPSNGVSPVIFDHAGNLHIIRPGPNITSQGYRYVADDGHLVMGDETYTVWNGLNEYTYLGENLWIGQGNQDGSGICVFDGTVLRQLDSGFVRFVRAHRTGQDVAIAYSKPEGVYLVKTTMAELRALPPLNSPPPTPPPPIVIPPPIESPTMPIAPNQLETVRAVLRDLVHVNPAAEVERGQITDEVVRRLGGTPWGRKDRDRNPDNHNNSDDALCYRLNDGRFEIYDILIGLPPGSPREAFAAFSYAGTFADGENGFFREVPGATPLPAPPANPPVPEIDKHPGPINFDFAPLLDKLEEIARRQELALQAAQDATVQAIQKAAQDVRTQGIKIRF